MSYYLLHKQSSLIKHTYSFILTRKTWEGKNNFRQKGRTNAQKRQRRGRWKKERNEKVKFMTNSNLVSAAFWRQFLQPRNSRQDHALLAAGKTVSSYATGDTSKLLWRSWFEFQTSGITGNCRGTSACCARRCVRGSHVFGQVVHTDNWISTFSRT
jgi:hypothetical protein